MPIIKFDVLERFSSEVAFTAEIDCDADASVAVKLGLAVRWAIKARADLTGADLTGADLTGAYLAGADLAGADLTGAYLTRADLTGAYLAGAYLARADLTGADLTGAYLARADLTGADLTGAYLTRADLTGADLVDGGQRSDGWRFIGWMRGGELMIRAGCRNFTLAQAHAHWSSKRGGTPLGDETMAILAHIESVARIRGLLSTKVEEAA